MRESMAPPAFAFGQSFQARVRRLVPTPTLLLCNCKVGSSQTSGPSKLVFCLLFPFRNRQRVVAPKEKTPQASSMLPVLWPSSFRGAEPSRGLALELASRARLAAGSLAWRLDVRTRHVLRFWGRQKAGFLRRSDCWC